MSRPSCPDRPRLLLAGAGHAHLTAIAPLAAACAGRARVTVLAPRRRLAYSGMMPGWIAGHYTLDQCLVDVGAVCERAGVAWIEDEATGIDPSSGHLVGRRGVHDAELLSLNIGAAPAPPVLDDGSVTVIAVKPFEAFTDGWQAWLDRIERDGGPATVVVAGGGAAAIEVAFAAAHRLRGRPRAAVTLVSAGRAASGLAPLAARWCLAGLRRAGVQVRAGRVTGVEGGEVRVRPDGGTGGGLERDAADARPIAASLLILATGPRPLPWLADSARRAGLPTDDDGFLVVDPTLRVPGRAGLFAAGDCATIRPDAVPRAGVHALRQGRVLAASMAAALDAMTGRGDDTAAGAGYRVRRPVLALLNRADGTAVASFGPLAAAGGWVWRWKDRIDRRFVDAFR